MIDSQLKDFTIRLGNGASYCRTVRPDDKVGCEKPYPYCNSVGVNSKAPTNPK